MSGDAPCARCGSTGQYGADFHCATCYAEAIARAERLTAERDASIAEVAHLRAEKPGQTAEITARPERLFVRAVAAANPTRLPRAPGRITIPSVASATDWVIKDIAVGSVAVPPYSDEDRRRDADRALRHDPMVARTLRGGPGNRSRIMACACRAPGVHDAATWAAHVGVPDAVDFLKTILRMEDAALDAVRYPGEGTLLRLEEVLRAARIVAPGKPVEPPRGRRLSWLSVHGQGVSRRCTWTGPARRVLITGLSRDFVESCPLVDAELPPGAEVFELSDHDDTLAIAQDRDGYVFTVRSDWKP